MKWGILATGNIAGKFAQTVGKMEKEEQIVAVGSRSLERGKEFAEKYGISTYYASYEELREGGRPGLERGADCGRRLPESGAGKGICRKIWNQYLLCLL